MPHFGPVKRRDLIAALRRAGFTGPYAGGKHEFMQKGDLALTIPNPHGSDIGPNLLSKLLRQAGISRDEWERL
jgi:predicted RNA binding protein YcfA (HicA-like mRNA interferase family)